MHKTEQTASLITFHTLKNPHIWPGKCVNFLIFCIYPFVKVRKDKISNYKMWERGSMLGRTTASRLTVRPNKSMQWRQGALSSGLLRREGEGKCVTFPGHLVKRYSGLGSGFLMRVHGPARGSKDRFTQGNKRAVLKNSKCYRCSSFLFKIE